VAGSGSCRDERPGVEARDVVAVEELDLTLEDVASTWPWVCRATANVVSNSIS
jgi:hypothetical protein